MSFSQLPNLITLSRIALVPVLILMLKDREYAAALAVFFLAGLSDGLDGLIAKRFGLRSQLGAVLDPLADKILLVTSYMMLTIQGLVPFWLMLTVVFRDLLIVGGYLIYTTLFGTVQMQPSRLSKFNTLMQIALVVALLAQQASGRSYPLLTDWLVYVVFATTVASGLHYLWTWGVMKEVRPAAGGSPGGRRE